VWPVSFASSRPFAEVRSVAHRRAKGADLRALLSRGELGAAPSSYPEQVVSLRTRVVGVGGSGDPRGRSMIVTSAPVGSAITETARVSTNRVPSAVTPPGRFVQSRERDGPSPGSKVTAGQVRKTIGDVIGEAWTGVANLTFDATLNVGSPVTGDARCALRWFVGVTTAQTERGRSVRSESAD
jgi:hypothetical protein